MKKNDFILIAMILLVAGMIYLYFYINHGKEADYAVVTINGHEYARYSLNEDREIEINENDNYNLLIIKDNKIYMKEANCKDEYCVEQGTKSRNGETIICLPHRLAVTIENSEKSDVDGIVK